MRFEHVVETTAQRGLRTEVREFLDRELPAERRTSLGMGGGGHDPEFSRLLGDQGWVGMAIPVEYGGRGATAVDRLIVTEELLAAQAPIGAHWVADRQTGPSVVRFGSPQQRAELLPGICAGTSYWAIGMSEPDSGSDLASVRTRARRVPGGWRVDGRKVWTTAAHLSHYFVVQCRTSGEPMDRHVGLSQLIVDLSAVGVAIRPIRTMDGQYDFCEVVLDDVFVPDERVLGEIGDGWHQVTSELSLERGGPERWMSVWGLFTAAVEELDAEPRVLGRLATRFRVLHELSLSVARMIDAGRHPVAEAAIAKAMGTTFEQEVVEVVRDLAERDIDPAGKRLDDLLTRTMLGAPTFTIRGGTTEVLRGIVGKELARSPRASSVGADPVLVSTAVQIFGELSSAAADGDTSWATLRDSGLPWVGIPEAAGGEGGSLTDAIAVLVVSAHYALPIPFAENWIAAYTLADAGLSVESVGRERPLTATTDLSRVPYARQACGVVTEIDGRVVRIALDDGSARDITAGTMLSGEPRDAVGRYEVLESAVPGPVGLLRIGALVRSVQIAGALARALQLTTDYANTRIQFDRPAARFQAVAHLIAQLAEQDTAARIAVDLAVAGLDVVDLAHRDASQIAVAKAVCGVAAGIGARLAHQVHGAIGVTQEYDLQLITRRLFTWRDDYGAERAWESAVGDRVAASNRAGLWRLVVGEEPVTD
ncbi:MAG: acyl-CoA dehydrogenase family protein [Jatrophihabitans sp.]